MQKRSKKSIQGLKLQSIWPALSCKSSLHESTVSVDPQGMSLGEGGPMEILLQLLQAQWTSRHHCGMVSKEAESSSNNNNKGEHTSVRQGKEEDCQKHGGGTKLQVLNRRTCVESRFGNRGNNTTRGTRKGRGKKGEWRKQRRSCMSWRSNFGSNRSCAADAQQEQVK